MQKPFGDYVKDFFSLFGLFVARQRHDAVTGHELPRDLRAVVSRNNPVCFDVGANRGQTIGMLQRCLSNPVIHAFEPASAVYTELSTQSFGASVHLHRLALGEQAEVATFRNYEHAELSSFLTLHPDRTENVFAQEELVSEEDVQVDTLTDFCAVRGITHIDLLKIDTQGFELPVLRGGAELLANRQVGAVLLELNFSTLYEGQSDPLAVMQLLRDNGMRLVDFYEKERMAGKEISWTTALFVRC